MPTLSRQLYEEALHVQFYLTLLDTYIPEPEERNEAFAAIHNIPSIKKKADFCFKWMGSISKLEEIKNDDDRRSFLLNLICFAGCIEACSSLLPLLTFTSCALRVFLTVLLLALTGFSAMNPATWNSLLK